MGIGLGILLVTIGAILLWAVEASFEAVNLDVVGLILLIAGVVGVLWGTLAASPRSSTTVEE
jgi:uncharacterized membrane protein YqjE